MLARKKRYLLYFFRVWGLVWSGVSEIRFRVLGFRILRFKFNLNSIYDYTGLFLYYLFWEFEFKINIYIINN